MGDVQPNRTILITAGNGIGVGIVHAGNLAVVPNGQFNRRVVPGGQEQAVQGHTLGEGVHKGELLIVGSRFCLHLPG